MSEIRVEGEAQKNHSRPPRLRFACNQCNTAKLKCSGERDGCIRCRTLRTECIYTESRVGKVQGNRKRKRLEPQVAQAPTSSTVTSRDQETGNVATSTALLPRGPLLTESSLETTIQPWTEPWASDAPWDDDMLNLDDPLTFEDMLEESTVASSRNPSTTSEVTNSSFQTGENSSTNGFNLGLPRDVPSSIPGSRAPLAGPQRHQGQTSLSLPSPQRETEVESPKQGFSKLDSRCVLACTHILVTLESYLLSELKALDLILAAVSKAADDLKKLVELQQESRCDRCIILFTTIMLQIVALLEAGSNPPVDNEPDIMGSILSGTQPGFGPAFGFGTFLPTSEEHKSWKSRILTREYRHVGEILSSLMVLARLGPRGASDDPTAVDSRLKCLGNIEQRLKEMLGKEGGGDM